MMLIKLNNNKCQLICETKIFIKLREYFKIRATGYFYSPAYRKRQWDGYWRYITEAGYFETGFLPKVYTYLKEQGYKIEFEDFRDHIKPGKIPLKIGNKIPFEHQIKAVESILNNKVDDIFFPRGIIDGATNFGKTLLSVMFYLTYKKPTIFLTKSKELFGQAITEMEEMIPGKIGYISSKKIVWNDFMICMAPTMSLRCKNLKNELERYQVLVVDEGDESTSATMKTCILACYNSIVKLCLSGTIFMHKDKDKNELVRSHFGEVTYRMSKKELIEKGISSEVDISVHEGNTTIEFPGEYTREFEYGIVRNKDRHRKIYRRLNYHLGEGHFPCLLIAQKRPHVQRVFKYLSKKYEGSGWVIEWCDHKRKDRNKVAQDFKDGKIDILVGSLIFRRGKNFPLMRYIANIGGGDSKSSVWQIMGRAERLHQDKGKKYYEDFWDIGKYLKRHSLHRLKALKATELPVREVYKNTIKGK